MSHQNPVSPDGQAVRGRGAASRRQAQGGGAWKFRANEGGGARVGPGGSTGPRDSPQRSPSSVWLTHWPAGPGPEFGDKAQLPPPALPKHVPGHQI